MKVIVFDLGGTLMEFRGMPPVWIDYYKVGFNSVNSKLNLGLSDDLINDAVQIMKSYNPRINYRENEIEPVYMFKKATANWNIDLDMNAVIECFFEGIKLNSVIYDYSFDLIEKYKADGYKIACLTDLPSGMPDSIFQKPIKSLIDKLDLYVSSQSCGYRKPNKYGLGYIANFFGVNVKELLFIGDEEKDKLAAQNTGCKFAFIKDIVM